MANNHLKEKILKEESLKKEKAKKKERNVCLQIYWDRWKV